MDAPLSLNPIFVTCSFPCGPEFPAFPENFAQSLKINTIA